MKKGIYLVLITAVISGLANFFNKFAMDIVGKNPYQYTTLKNGAVAIILLALVASPHLWPKLKKISRVNWLKLILIGLIGGCLPFLLFFKGLSMTSAVNASFIHKTLFIWAAIIAWPILKEKIGKLQFAALALLIVGNLIFSPVKNFFFGYAETLILIATILWAVENVIAKIVLKDLDALLVAWGRMFFGAILLIIFLLFTGNASGLLVMDFSQFGWLALSAVLLTGYVVTWYGALKKLPITVVTSFLVLASPITALLNAVFVTHKLPAGNIWGTAIILVAVIFIWGLKPKENYEVKQVGI